MQISDETLMALADGELAPDQAREVASHVAADPALTARLEQFAATRRVLREWAEEAPLPAVDPSLEAMIRAATSPQADARPSRIIDRLRAANLNRRPLAAIAAALALVVVGLGFYSNYDGGPAGRDDEGGTTLAAALDRVPAGEGRILGDGAELVIIASYRNHAGELCREYEIQGNESLLQVACHQDDTGWQERFSVALNRQDDGFVPASGQIEALDRFLGEIGAGAPMTTDEEASALSALN